MNKRVKKRINKFASFTLARTLVGAGLVNVVLVPQNYTLAAKNADGVCEIDINKQNNNYLKLLLSNITKMKNYEQINIDIIKKQLLRNKQKRPNIITAQP